MLTSLQNSFEKFTRRQVKITYSKYLCINKSTIRNVYTQSVKYYSSRIRELTQFQINNTQITERFSRTSINKPWSLVVVPILKCAHDKFTMEFEEKFKKKFKNRDHFSTRTWTYISIVNLHIFSINKIGKLIYLIIGKPNL